MCGIAGLFVPYGNTVPDLNLDAMLSMMTHRGPDGEGHFVTDDRRCHLGFRRLAIIDLDTGNQPIHDPGTQRSLVGNGEIYNYIELRKQLVDYPFTTTGDMETVLALARRDGDDFVNALNGMYALALYHGKDHRLELVRDRVGVKPLYYATTPSGAVVFASEIKALFAAGLVTPSIHEPAVNAYLAHGWVPAPMTLFKGVKALPPGNRLSIARDGTQKLERYWRATPDQEFPCDAEGAAETIRAVLEDSVQMQLRSDVPVGALLSGGLDSGLMVALAAQHTAKPLKTFTVSFSGAKVDEAPLAAQIANRYGTDHTRITVPETDVGKILPKLAWLQESPINDAALLPNWLVEEELGRHVTVALNGTGGDELFAGYGRYFQLPIESRYLSLPAPFRSAIETFLKFSAPMTAWKLARADQFATDIGAYVHNHTTHFPAPVRKLIGNRMKPVMPAQATQANDVDAPDQTRALYADLNTYLPDDLLMLLDRTSMGHSVEGRVPFLDHRLVTAGMAVPPEVRTPNGQQKGLLRAIAKDFLPPDVLSARKQGFASPVPTWMKAGLGQQAGRILTTNQALSRGWWTAQGIDRLLSDPEIHGFRVYSLLMLELAVRMVIEGPLSSSMPNKSLDDLVETQG